MFYKLKKSYSCHKKNKLVFCRFIAWISPGLVDARLVMEILRGKTIKEDGLTWLLFNSALKTYFMMSSAPSHTNAQQTNYPVSYRANAPYSICLHRIVVS